MAAFSPTLIKSILLSEKIIKPSSPTPPTKKLHKLSLIDQALTNIYIPFALFYPKQQLDAISKIPSQISQILENSLSQLLTLYYPYAGRLHNNTSIIDCDDTGAEFLQVQIGSPIVEALDWHNTFIEGAIFPKNLPWGNCTDRRLVVAQLSYFNCGGMAISMCISHKIGDGCNGYYLFRDWAEITRNPNCAKPSLSYLEQSIYPSPPSGLPAPVIDSNTEDCAQRRYIFSPSKLCKLKALVAAEAEIQNPTRTEVVSALLFKSIVSATKANLDSFPPSTLVQYIDLRGLLNLPPNVVGNLLTSFPASIHKEENMKLSTIVSEMRKGKDQAFKRDNVKENVWVDEILESALAKEEMYNGSGCDTYHCSSLVKFPLHEIDFGWGKPIKVSIANGPSSKVIYLMGNGDGGLDAFVMLSQQVMSVLERDIQLLEFAYLVPTS